MHAVLGLSARVPIHGAAEFKSLRMSRSLVTDSLCGDVLQVAGFFGDCNELSGPDATPAVRLPSECGHGGKTVFVLRVCFPRRRSIHCNDSWNTRGSHTSRLKCSVW